MKRCKWEEIYIDQVPVPFGVGNCSMETSYCVYDGEIDISALDTCNENCPAYEEYKEELNNEN